MSNFIKSEEKQEITSKSFIPPDTEIITSKKLMIDKDSNDSNSNESNEEENNSSDSEVTKKLKEILNLLYNFFDVPLNKAYKMNQLNRKYN